MNFLYPLFLTGIAAVGIPILLHMVRQRTRKHITFSSLMFLPAAAPRFKNRNRIENLPLLLLRCAIIALLAFAFSRPFFSRPISDKRNRPVERIALLIDTSASMRRAGLWEQAMDEAKSVIRGAGRGDSLCIMSFDQEARTLMGFEEWSQLEPAQRVSSAVQSVSQLTPGWRDTNLGNALVTAAEAVEDNEIDDSQQAAAIRRIVLVSDLQEGSDVKALSTYEWPGRMGLSIKSVRPEGAANAALQLITDGSEAGPGDANDPPRIRVTNSSDSDAEQFQINWASDAAGQAPNEPVNVYAAPGRSSVARAPARFGVSPSRKLILTGDAPDFDNTLYIAPSLRRPISILYIGDDDPNDTAEMLFYVRLAFKASGVLSPNVIRLPGHKDIAKAQIDSAHLIIVGDAVSAGNIAALRRGGESGRLLLLAMKSAKDAETLAGLTKSESIEAEEAEVDRYAMLSQIEYTHPLLAPFSEPRFGDFTQIHFWKYRRIDADLPGASVLLRFDTGDAALLEVPLGKGTLLALTSSWRREDSQLALSSKFVSLLYSILEYGGVRTRQQLQYFVGDSVPVVRSAANKSADISVRKPDGSVVTLGPTEETFSQTDGPGIYTVESADESRLFAVNVSAKESRTAPMPVEDIEKLGVLLHEGDSVPSEQNEQVRCQANLAEMEYEQKLWRRLLIALLSVVLVESALAGWLTRPAAATDGEQS